MKKYDVCIIGAGASGLAAAISCKRNNPDFSVVLVEGLPRVGKKILVTGNGRCNITNLNAVCHEYKNRDFALDALEKYNPSTVIDFFKSLGLFTYTDEDERVYPRSNSAASVLDALRLAVSSSGVDIICDHKVSSVNEKNGSFTIDNEIECLRLIIACGGRSSSVHGSDGSGYKLASQLGHSVTKTYPSLVPLNVNPEKVRALKGVRCVNVKLEINDDYDEEESFGEVLFTENGVSGIAAMELASFAEKSLAKGNDPVLSINFLPEYEYDNLCRTIENLVDVNKGRSLDNLLTGLVPKSVGIAVLKNASVYYGDAVVEEMSSGMIESVAESLESFNLKVMGTKGFSNSQVTSGGIPVAEIDGQTMKSKLVDNLYFCGEIIDVDGRCGGYNLQWAFASGLLAGELK